MPETPVFAVVGHPNEGKSSVVSTLTEDDRVPVSAVPGETTRCVPYAIRVEGETLLRFVDTPGFQMPLQTLRWMREYTGPAEGMVAGFIRAHRDDPRFRDDCELLRPVAEGAGVIYVVDGSRPLRPNDEAEMEILRLTGRPRLAVINPKAAGEGELGEWKAAFARTFNVQLQFDAHRATFRERIHLLQALQHVEQEWSEAIARVVAALQADWQARLAACGEDILELLDTALTLSVAGIAEGEEPTDRERQRESLVAEFRERITALERTCQQRIRSRFRHNLFDVDLVAETVATEDLFARETWEALGLTRAQLSLALAATGAAVGTAVDVAAAGISFGVFTLGGGLAGGVAGWAGTRPLARLRVDVGPFSRELGGCRIVVGPLRNPQLLFVLLDRALIYLQCAANWAHARRDRAPPALAEGKQGVTASWERGRRQLFEKYRLALQKGFTDRVDALRPELQELLMRIMAEAVG